MSRMDEQCQAMIHITWQLAYARDFMATTSMIKLSNKIEGIRSECWAVYPYQKETRNEKAHD